MTLFMLDWWFRDFLSTDNAKLDSKNQGLDNKNIRVIVIDGYFIYAGRMVLEYFINWWWHQLVKNRTIKDRYFLNCYKRPNLCRTWGDIFFYLLIMAITDTSGYSFLYKNTDISSLSISGTNIFAGHGLAVYFYRLTMEIVGYIKD